MRSFAFTLILVLLAGLACGLAGWQWKEGNFDTVFGSPPVPVGQRIYTAFQPADVKHLQVSQGGVTARFELTASGWRCTDPWQDRMDPRAAVTIINFTLGMRVEDFAASGEIDAQKAGFKDSGIQIRLEGADRKPLARFKLGRQTPWMATVEDIKGPVPTVFVQPRDERRSRHIYACTGDIAPLFKDGLKFLRDHRPFYFNPTALREIRIRAGEGELTLARATRQSPWRVTKPLDLATDPKAMKSLLEGLFELQALKISDRASAPVSAEATPAKSSQISLQAFDSESESTLEISPPATPAARETRATVSDRPDVVFDLPLKPEADLVSLADLPLAINDLRDASLTHLNVASLRGVLIQPATGTEILVTRTPPSPWMVTIGGQSQEANEERLFALLKAVTEGRATAFETDAATDFTPWGLHKPFLKLRFLGEDDQGIELVFGLDGRGGYFVNRRGTPAVMRVDPALVASLPVKSYEWRHSRLWSIDRLNLLAIGRKSGAEPPLSLLYDFNSEQWTATADSRDLTPLLIPERANFLLGILEGLKVTRWLSPDDESATAALARPSLVFKIIENTTDDAGEISGRVTREVTLAPATTGANPGFYYGRLGSDMNPFLLDRETYGKLAVGLLEE